MCRNPGIKQWEAEHWEKNNRIKAQWDIQVLLSWSKICFFSNWRNIHLDLAKCRVKSGANIQGQCTLWNCMYRRTVKFWRKPDHRCAVCAVFLWRLPNHFSLLSFWKLTYFPCSYTYDPQFASSGVSAPFHKVTLFSGHGFHVQKRNLMWELKKKDWKREQVSLLLYETAEQWAVTLQHRDCESKSDADMLAAMMNTCESPPWDRHVWQVLHLHFHRWGHWGSERFSNLPKVKQKLVDLGYQPKDSGSRSYMYPLCSTTSHGFWVLIPTVSASFFIT